MADALLRVSNSRHSIYPDATQLYRANRMALRHQQDRCLPECSLLSRWIEYGHLAVVLARRKLAQIDREVERRSLQLQTRTRRHLYRLRLVHLRLSLVKADKANQWLSGRRRWLIGLQVHIQAAPLAEHPSHAADQLLAVLYQRVSGNLLGLLLPFRGVVDGIGHERALARQHHRADGYTLRLFAQVRNHERRLERPDLPRRIVPRQHLDRVLAWQ